MLKQELKELISKGRIKAAIQKLQDNTGDDLHNQAVDLSGRFTSFSSQKNGGLLSEREANVTQNQIVYSLLSLIDELPNNATASPSSPSTNEVITSISEKAVPKNLWKKWLAIFATVVGVLAGIAEISGYSVKDFLFGNEAESLTLTIKVRDLAGNRPLKNEGKLVIDYGHGTQAPPIDQQGKVDLREIAPHLKGNKISIVLEDAPHYVAAEKKEYILDGKAILFKVKKNQALGRIQGKIRSRDGQRLLAKVQIEVDGEVTYSDSLGNFLLQMPLEKWKSEYTIFAKKGDFLKEEKYYPNTPNFEIRLPNQ